MKFLIIADYSEANRGYTPTHKYYVEAKNLQEAKRKVAKKEDISVSNLEHEEGDEYRVDGMGIFEIIPLSGKKSEFGGVF